MNEGNNKANSRNYISVEIPQHRRRILVSVGVQRKRDEARSCCAFTTKPWQPSWVDHLLELPATRRWRRTRRKQPEALHIWRTHKFRGPVMFSVTSLRWRRLLSTKPNMEIKAWTWCDWDFRLGAGFAAASQATLPGWTLIQLLNGKQTRKVRCGEIRRDGFVWYRLLHGLAPGQKRR